MDQEKIYIALRARYAEVAKDPGGQFKYPTGRASAEQLGYPSDSLASIPAAIVDRFVGVGNPFSLGEPKIGWNVCDVGCGAGFDSQVASRYVGSQGHVLGVDLSEEMLDVAIDGIQGRSASNITFRQGRAECLPVDGGWADLVISNGVLNLAACKASAFAEIARILKPGGRFQAADLVLVKTLPEDLRSDEYAWSG